MKYFVLLAGYGEMPLWDELSAQEQEEGMARHEQFSAACEARPGVEMVAGEALADGSQAITLRTVAGEMVVTNGPFAEAAEHLGGYYVIEVPDLDAALRYGAMVPSVAWGTVEVRPLMSYNPAGQ